MSDFFNPDIPFSPKRFGKELGYIKPVDSETKKKGYPIPRRVFNKDRKEKV